MGKALLGTHASPNTLRLLDEVRSLRARVDELERALAAAETVRDSRSSDRSATDQPVALDDREPVTT